MAVTEKLLINCDAVTHDKHSYNLGDLNTVMFLPFLYLASYYGDTGWIIHSAEKNRLLPAVRTFSLALWVLANRKMKN
jgi:hypothetical protein